jgi:hypothetical protein
MYVVCVVWTARGSRVCGPRGEAESACMLCVLCGPPGEAGCVDREGKQRVHVCCVCCVDREGKQRVHVCCVCCVDRARKQGVWTARGSREPAKNFEVHFFGDSREEIFYVENDMLTYTRKGGGLIFSEKAVDTQHTTQLMSVAQGS